LKATNNNKLNCFIIIGRNYIINEVDKMAERIGKEKIEREDGYLYYLGKDGYVWRVSFDKDEEPEKVGNEHIKLEKGFRYFVEKDGYLYKYKPKKLRYNYE